MNIILTVVMGGAFEHNHILATIYGWQRWKGDEHKSGWNEKTLKELICSKCNSEGHFDIYISDTPEIYRKLGLHRNRFDRKHDAHLYVKLKKVHK